MKLWYNNVNIKNVIWGRHLTIQIAYNSVWLQFLIVANCQCRPWEILGDSLSSQVPDTYLKELNWVPGSEFLIPFPPIVSIWGMGQ